LNNNGEAFLQKDFCPSPALLRKIGREMLYKGIPPTF